MVYQKQLRLVHNITDASPDVLEYSGSISTESMHQKVKLPTFLIKIDGNYIGLTSYFQPAFTERMNQ